MATNIYCSAQFSIIINQIDITCIRMPCNALHFAGPFTDGNRAQIIKCPFVHKSSKFAAFISLFFQRFSTLSHMTEVRFVFYIVNPSFPAAKNRATTLTMRLSAQTVGVLRR